MAEQQTNPWFALQGLGQMGTIASAAGGAIDYLRAMNLQTAAPAAANERPATLVNGSPSLGINGGSKGYTPVQGVNSFGGGVQQQTGGTLDQSGAWGLNDGALQSRVVSVTPNGGGAAAGVAGGGYVDKRQQADDTANQQESMHLILDRLKVMSDQSNAKNEARYGEMLGNNDAMAAGVDQMGQQAKSRIKQQGTQQQARTASSAISRGLGNSTIVDSLQRGVQSDVNDQLLGVREAKQRMKMDVLGQRNNIIENRNDVGPDGSLYAGLLNNPGAMADPEWLKKLLAGAA